MINSNRNKIDPSLPSPIQTTLKNYIKNHEEYERKGMRVILLGDSRESDKLFKANNKRWDYDKYGLHFASFGNKTIIRTSTIKNKDIDGFIALSKEMAKKLPVAVPENVETIRFTLIKEVFEDQKIESVGDGFATVLADIIVSPLLVVGQLYENATNSIQGLKNMSAKKKMAYLQYCMAILKYLENESALVE